MVSKIRNVLMLCLAYTFVIIAFQTTTGLQNLILTSVMEDDPEFENNSFLGLLIFYVVYALSQWVIPSFIAISGPRFAMFVGSITFGLYVLEFMYPVSIILYIMNVVLGAGSAIMWNAHGTYIARCSDMSSATMHSGIYWTMYYTSGMIGSIISKLLTNGKTYMESNERLIVLGVLLVSTIIGISGLTLMRYVESNQSPDLKQELSFSCAMYTFKVFVKLFFSPDMIALWIMFIYTGLHQSFCSATFGLAISNTLWLADAPEEIASMTTLVRHGSEIIGAVIFAAAGNYTSRWGRDPMIGIAGLMHLIGAILIYVNIPNEAGFEETEEVSTIDPPRPWIIYLCAFLVACGTSISTVHIYSMLIGTFVDNATGAVSTFKMLQSIALAVAFSYSAHVSLYIQLGVLILFDILGVMGFCFVEFKAKQGDLGPPYEVIKGVGTPSPE